MQVIDVDSHVIEPTSVWDHLARSDEEFRPSILVKEVGAPIAAHFSGPQTREFWVIDNTLYGKHDVGAIVDASNGELEAGAITMEDIGQRLSALDKQGVDVQIIFSSLFLNLRIARPNAELALTRAYNRWMAERCAESDGRLRWIMVPSLKNPAETIADMKHAQENGAVGILFRGIEGNRVIDHQHFDPIYAQAQELDLPICVHIGHGSPALRSIAYRENSEFNRFNSDSPNYTAFSALLLSGLYKQFPKLRFGFFESGSSWIAANIQTTLHLRLAPDDLMRLAQERMQESNFFVTCELHEDLNLIARYTGEDKLMLGSDYGHPNDIADTMISFRRELAERGDISTALQDKLVSQNCGQLFSL